MKVKMVHYLLYNIINLFFNMLDKIIKFLSVLFIAFFGIFLIILMIRILFAVGNYLLIPYSRWSVLFAAFFSISFFWNSEHLNMLERIFFFVVVPMFFFIPGGLVWITVPKYLMSVYVRGFSLLVWIPFVMFLLVKYIETPLPWWGSPKGLDLDVYLYERSKQDSVMRVYEIKNFRGSKDAQQKMLSWYNYFMY